MFPAAFKRATRLAVIFFTTASALRADNWAGWGQVPATNPAGHQLATDGTNIFYSAYLDGVYRAALADKTFSALPMTGFPLADATTNPTNGLIVSAVSATPQGTVVIAGSPVWVTANSIQFNPPSGPSNTQPVFYWFDETNQVWHAANITGKTYPYTGNVGNFSVAPDGSLWGCSGFYPYAYRSTDGGKNFTAFDINARVPTNYFPMPINGISSFGEIFSIFAGWNNEVVIGTETGGYLHTTNNGAAWTSLDPNFTSVSSTNPLGRTGDARVLGQDKYGNFLCGNFLTVQSVAQSNWGGVKFIGWRPRDNSVFAATNGFAGVVGPGSMVTTPGGQSFIFQPQNYLLQGGVWRSPNGRDWSQFNQGSGLDTPFPPGLTNVFAQGNCIAASGNQIFIANGTDIFTFDATPPPITNRPPAATPQNVNLFQNTPTNLTLAATDADGDALNFTVITPPAHGTLTGSPPNVTYSPGNNFTGLDTFTFVADDGVLTSSPAFFQLAINAATNPPPVISIASSPPDGGSSVAPANITLTAVASDNGGFVRVNFYDGTNGLASLTNPPFAVTVTNVAVGEHVFYARATDNFSARTWAHPVKILVLPFAARPAIRRADPLNAAMTWPSDLDGFFLEQSAVLSGPWTLATNAPSYFASGATATVTMTNAQFFRLARPF